MKQSLYCIFDAIAEIFNRPFVEVNDASAIRSFTQAMNKEEAVKTDYQLFKLGDYTDHNGVITPLSAPKRIFSGTDIKS